MKQKKPTQTIIIRDPRAVAIINERAEKENRSRSNCASTIIIENSNKNTGTVQGESEAKNGAN